MLLMLKVWTTKKEFNYSIVYLFDIEGIFAA